MKDAEGRVTIDGFYDDAVPLTAEEKKAIDEIPDVAPVLMKTFGFSRPETTERLELRHNLPTLNINAMDAGGGVGGQGRTIIPAQAQARLDLRFVKGVDPTKQFERLYDGRTAVERVNGRLKIFWGIDDGQVYGARRFHGHVGAVMVVHLAFATLLAQTARREGIDPRCVRVQAVGIDHQRRLDPLRQLTREPLRPLLAAHPGPEHDARRPFGRAEDLGWCETRARFRTRSRNVRPTRRDDWRR